MFKIKYTNILLLSIGLICPNIVKSQIFGNYVPVIIGQKQLDMTQGESITIQLTDLYVFDLNDPYPQGFTLNIYGGKNYAFEGTTVTPDPKFKGQLTVKVTVSDGKDESKRYDLKITVHERPNVPPQITGQVPLSILQGEAITLKFEHLMVDDPDDDYPGGFTLHVASGQNYTVSGTKVTPSPSFTGNLTVKVSVNDGEDESAPFNLIIEVRPRNVAPVITSQIPININEGTSITITLGHLKVEDPDNKYPDDFTLKVFPGDNYTLSGNTVTPKAGFSGELTVGVTVSDGKAESPLFALKINVLHENVAPRITGQFPLSTNEETSLTILLTNLKVTDPDNQYPQDFTLKVFPGTNYTVAGKTITPNSNYTGTLQVGVSVHDGEAESDIFNLQIQVIPVNDPPVITGQVALSMDEDTNITLSLSHLTVSDPDNVYPADFTLKVLPGADYTVNNHTVTPSLNFNGILSVSVTVNDGTSNSQPFNLSITVNPVSDPPLIELESTAGVYLLGKGPVPFSEEVVVTDPDQDSITYAELGFAENHYREGSDVLIYNKPLSSKIEGVFDASRGILFLIGTASAEEYTEAIRSIKYDYQNAEENPLTDTLKTIYVYARDGFYKSATKERNLTMISSIKLHIPNFFTPNGDYANDTWRIHSTNTSDEYREALVRVYNIRGMLVYEATGLDNEWDGKYGGTTLPSDTYYYTINLNLTYTRATYKGIVTILH